MTMTDSHTRFRPRLDPPQAVATARWFAFRGADLLVREAGSGRVDVPIAEAPAIAVVRSQYLGELDGVACFSAELAKDAALPTGYRFSGIRALYDKMDPALFDLAGLAFQIAEWDRTHQICGVCGAPTARKEHERARHCGVCGHESYPRVHPALIVLVHDGERALMTRQARFPPGMYGLVAGFLEPGETLEACAAREVLEETGIVIEDLRYFGSQPWPFPHQIMVGFFARYKAGEIVVETRELEDARWFERTALPPLPPKISIARALVDAWLAGSNQTK